MIRRNLLRGFVGAASGLLVPAGVGEMAAEVERRYWALGAMPGRGLVYPDYLETPRYDAGKAWDIVVTGIEMVGEMPNAYMRLQHVKVPRTGTRFTVSAQWANDV